MLQKMLDVAKSRVFIFNAVTIVVCVLTAIAIPQIIGKMNAFVPIPEEEKITTPLKSDNESTGDEDKGVEDANSVRPLDEVFGEGVPQNTEQTNGATGGIIEGTTGGTTEKNPNENDNVAIRILKLKATHSEALGGDKFWQIEVIDESDIVVKSWAEIFAEYEADPTVIQIDGNNFVVTVVGLHCTVSGAYSVPISYSGLTVEISKVGTTFR
jgi:hypothetical protein